ncbi:MAG: GAF domain-containing protein [Alphaproteobacteria bacterium]|nr:GAF domain-containing protein [Alphaproteobacteria bacterium]
MSGIDDASHFRAVAAAQARPGQPGPTFAALADALQALVGYKVMTILRLDTATLRSVRLFSSEPSYPPGGTKQHRRGAWSAAIVDRRSYFLAPRRDNVHRNFPDYQGIEAAGCASIVCLPVLYDGRCLATLNLWHVDGHYDAAAAERALPFASLLVPACLA